MSVWLTIQAWAELLYVDMVATRGFRAMEQLMRHTPTRALRSSDVLVPHVVAAMESACAVYIKRPRCLQRSMVVTRLLRRRGIPADLVVGCHLAPLRAHAWVEVAGDVVSDDVDDLRYFCILDRW